MHSKGVSIVSHQEAPMLYVYNFITFLKNYAPMNFSHFYCLLKIVIL